MNEKSLKINIHLTNEEKEMLKQYAKLYSIEREKDITQNPIVTVKTKKSRPVDPERAMNAYVCCNFLEEDWYTFSRKELCKHLLELEEKEDIILEIVESVFDKKEDYYENGYKIDVFYMEDYYDVVAYFFTREEAEKYCKYQSHNLNDPIVYTESWGYMNKGDFPIFQKLLLRIGEELNNE